MSFKAQMKKKLDFNPKKCAAMRFSRKKGPDQSQNYYLNNQLIKFTTSQSDLGILVSNNLKWSLHINNVVSKAYKMLGFIRRNCFHLGDVNARRLL